MSYRTKINGVQIFGNNDYFVEWIDYIKSKGIIVDDDGCYKGTLDNFMEAVDVLESIVISLDKSLIERRTGRSLFDLSSVRDEYTREHGSTSLLDNQLDLIENGYLFLPLTFKNACADVIEIDEYNIDSKHFRNYKLKDGCKIKVEAR